VNYISSEIAFKKGLPEFLAALRVYRMFFFRSCLNLAAGDKKSGFFVQNRGNFKGIAGLWPKNLLGFGRERRLFSPAS
jgi:hypothetical protein